MNMVGNASEEGLLTKLDHPSHSDPTRTTALVFLVLWLTFAMVLIIVGLTAPLALVASFIPLALAFMIVRKIRIIRLKAAQSKARQDEAQAVAEPTSSRCGSAK